MMKYQQRTSRQPRPRRKNKKKLDIPKIVRCCKKKTEVMIKEVTAAAMGLARAEGTSLVTALHVVEALKAKMKQLVDPLNIGLN
jgi:hypothetical protein